MATRTSFQAQLKVVKSPDKKKKITNFLKNFTGQAEWLMTERFLEIDSIQPTSPNLYCDFSTQSHLSSKCIANFENISHDFYDFKKLTYHLFPSFIDLSFRVI